MQFKLISFIYTELKLLLFKKTFAKVFFVKPKFITLIPIKNNFNLINMLKINNFLNTFFKKKNRKDFVTGVKFFFKKINIYKFYFNFFKKTYIYNLHKLDQIKLNLYNWSKHDLKFLNISFPFNSRFKISYQRNADKIFFTTSSGILAKLFGGRKKSLRHSKKIFKLGMLLLSEIIYLSGKYLLVLTLKSIHKSLSFFLELVIKYFNLDTKMYVCYFDYKKFISFKYFRKKRSIKKKVQKRLMVADYKSNF